MYKVEHNLTRFVYKKMGNVFLPLGTISCTNVFSNVGYASYYVYN